MGRNLLKSALIDVHAKLRMHKLIEVNFVSRYAKNRCGGTAISRVKSEMSK